MTKIPLGKGFVALVDNKDVKKLSKYNWYIVPSNRNPEKYDTHYYAATFTNYKTLYMHRYLLNAKKGTVCDHIDGDGLNNTRKNIRLATPSQNGANRKPTGKSRYLGVSWAKNMKRWTATIRKDGRNYNLGFYEDEKDAAKAYNKMASKLHGKFAKLNIIKP